MSHQCFENIGYAELDASQMEDFLDSQRTNRYAIASSRTFCLRFSTIQYLQYTICSWAYQNASLALGSKSCKIPRRSHFLTILIACTTFLSTRCLGIVKPLRRCFQPLARCGCRSLDTKWAKMNRSNTKLGFSLGVI